MKRICCIDCKRATKNWNYTGLLFCTSTIDQHWSWAWGKAMCPLPAEAAETILGPGIAEEVTLV